MKTPSKFYNIFQRLRKNNSKICTDTQRPQIEKAILSRKNTAEEHSIILFYLKLHYKAMVTKSASCWYKQTCRPMEHYEDPEINL